MALLVKITLAVLGLLVLAVAAAQIVRLWEAREAEAAWQRIAARAQDDPEVFTPEMLDGLPEPARRYLAFAIAPGTPLRTVVELEMQGEFALGDRDRPGYMPMYARQILAPPHGLVWIPRIGSGLMRITGSDALVDDRAWVRFWLLYTVPVARASSSEDLLRAATGRALAESLWAPASLLPRNGAVWEAVDDSRARVGFEIRGERFEIELELAEDGRPTAFSMMRWSDANPDRTFRFQPFGGAVEDVASFEGFTIPSRIAVGNHYGTEAYFPFFVATITGARYR